ncbi:MAG TPA: hypothetical protein VMW76_02195 [Bacteroidales bacterium]|nr:hypothetical protein [Bacteroidales bacterium]
MTEQETFFAPAERTDIESGVKSHNLVYEHGYIKDLFMAMPDVAAVLNRERQIVYCSDVLLCLLSGKDYFEVPGARSGEALSCIHSAGNEAGCGTSEHCRHCGAMNAIFRG